MSKGRLLASPAAAAEAARRRPRAWRRSPSNIPTGRARGLRPAPALSRRPSRALLRAWLLRTLHAALRGAVAARVLADIGGWDEQIAKNQDGDLVYRALARRPRIAFSDQGLGVYVQDDEPRRITNRHDARALGSQLAVLDRVRGMTARRSDLRSNEELSRAYYSLARSPIPTRATKSARRRRRRRGSSALPASPARPRIARCRDFGLARQTAPRQIRPLGGAVRLRPARSGCGRSRFHRRRLGHHRLPRLSRRRRRRAPSKPLARARARWR